ncbi:MAG: glutamine-hydrolyzing GMP synthase [Flavobacteriales bacterium]|nr:MAG: glutamine-hydrolyzing GMP synthase [Flavobacteriales bacterium]
MTEKILILDFGSQYTQLIARRLRELFVYCEIHPYNHIPELTSDIKGIILSGSPCSVNEPDAPMVDLETLMSHGPLLGVCYGAQMLAKEFGGVVSRSDHREYGRAVMQRSENENALLTGLSNESQVWMSHGDTITALPNNAQVIATTPSIPVAAFELQSTHPVFGIQFHPEVYHSTEGLAVFKNFAYSICGCAGDWTPGHFIDETVSHIRKTVGTDQVILGLSGGVDSSVAALLLHKAIGKQLHCIFIDNGLLRKNEFALVQDAYKQLDLNVIAVDSSKQFYDALKGLTDPEDKRKAIGRVFVEVFQEESLKIKDAKWLAQGTIYPDVIESVSVKGPSATIKSHHNVGGLPEKMSLKIIEPLRSLFKDEVRRVGDTMGLPHEILHRHPFPGPGLGIRILGDITEAKVKLLQEADWVYMEKLREYGWYEKIWQAGAILLPIQSVGVMGDERTYEQVVALRAVTSTDGMTADWVHIPYDILADISNSIINRVRGINRVVYDISSKPPATIEWE